MTRQHLSFGCEGDTLVGTLDHGEENTGLLIVSGGNELRSGTFAGQAALAARIAAKGFPVFRFDRRGVGDSEGENHGFRSSREDIHAALGAFRAQCPHVHRVVAFGNCDAASALMLMGGEGCDALVLSNPWAFDEDEVDEALPPPSAIRSRYFAKLRNPREVLRLLRGQVDIRRLLRGLKSATGKSAAPTTLAQELAEGIGAYDKSHVILIAGEDRTGQAFAAGWLGETKICKGASHAYVEPHASEWLEAEILKILRG